MSLNRPTPHTLIQRSRDRRLAAVEEAQRIGAFLRRQNGVHAAQAQPSADNSRISAVVWVVDTPYGLPRRRLADGTLVTELNAYETDYLHQEIFIDRVYAPEGFDLPPRPLVFDVGANIGLFSLFIAREHPGATIIAFEPSPDAFTALAANVEDLGLPVTCLPAAVGGAGGSRDITIYPAASVFSGLHTDQHSDWAAIRATLADAVADSVSAPVVDDLADARMLGARTTTVGVVTLSDILASLDGRRVDLLKLDAEGSETEILASLGPSIHRIDQIILEAHNTADVDRIVGLLTDVGYDCTTTTIDAMRSAGFTNVYAKRPTTDDLSRKSAPTSWQESAAPPSAYGRLRAAVNDVLRDGDLPVDLEVRRGPAPTVAVHTQPAEADPRVMGILAEIWSDLLDRRVEPTDDFFDLGGSSVIAVWMLARARAELGGAVDLDELRANPTLDAFARQYA